MWETVVVEDGQSVVDINEAISIAVTVFDVAVIREGGAPIEGKLWGVGNRRVLAGSAGGADDCGKVECVEVVCDVVVIDIAGPYGVLTTCGGNSGIIYYRGDVCKIAVAAMNDNAIVNTIPRHSQRV